MTVLLPMSEKPAVTATIAERVPNFSVRTSPPLVLPETVVSPTTSSSMLFFFFFFFYLVNVLKLTRI